MKQFQLLTIKQNTNLSIQLKETKNMSIDILM